MSTGLILLVILAVAVVVYFVFFNNSKIEYSEEKLKDIFKISRNLLTLDDGDHEIVRVLKERLLKDVNITERFYNRKPSMYTLDEIAAIDKLVPETKQNLRDVCERLEKLIPLIDNSIDQGKKLISKTRDTIKLINETNEKTEEDEDMLDLFEKILEKTPNEVKQNEIELMILKNNIEKYKII